MMMNIQNLSARQKFLSKPEMQKNLNLVMGLQQNKEKVKDLSPELKREIVKKYVNMYYSLTSMNWIKGDTLGVSWQKALRQMDEYVKSKTKVLGHPMNPCLIAIHAKYRRAISETLLTNPNVDLKLELAPEKKKQWEKIASEDIKTDMTFFNGVHKDYMPKQDIAKQSGVEPFAQAQLKAAEMVKKIIVAQQMQARDDYQRAA